MIAPDFRGTQDSATFGRAEVMRNVADTTTQLRDLRDHDREIRIYGNGTVGVVTSRASWRTEKGEDPGQYGNRYTEVWVKRDGRWQVGRPLLGGDPDTWIGALRKYAAAAAAAAQRLSLSRPALYAQPMPINHLAGSKLSLQAVAAQDGPRRQPLVGRVPRARVPRHDAVPYGDFMKGLMVLAALCAVVGGCASNRSADEPGTRVRDSTLITQDTTDPNDTLPRIRDSVVDPGR